MLHTMEACSKQQATMNWLRFYGINCLPAIKNYWSVEEGLGNSLIQKAMTRAPFWEILQNMHFADNLQN